MGECPGSVCRHRGETEAESFCYSFPTALRNKKAAVAVKGEKIVFTHQGYFPAGETNPHMMSDPGEYAATLTPQQAEALEHLLKCSGPYQGMSLRVSYITAWGYGFMLRVR